MIFSTAIRRILPPPWHASLARQWRRAVYFGLTRQCPVCKSHLRCFLPHGSVRRENAICPICMSRERHRLAWLHFRGPAGLFEKPGSLLHLAPEPELSKRLSRMRNVRYFSADLCRYGMIHMDLTHAAFQDRSFDLIYACHVLNCLPDDRAAMGEIFRMLKPGGSAIVQVPMSDQRETLEAPSVELRERLFGDAWIFRKYGRDMEARLRAVGFEVSERGVAPEFGDAERHRFGLLSDEVLHVCTKPGASPRAPS